MPISTSHSGKMFERGVAVISIDTECLWGHFDRLDEKRFHEKFPNATAVADGLLACLCQADLSATWAVVGGLALGECAGSADPRMQGLPPYWIRSVPAGNQATAPLWYHRSFVRRIRDARPTQDVGLHGGLTHMIWNDPRASRETLQQELSAGVHALEEISIRPRSFVFPRNKEARLSLLPQAGIRCYRGRGPTPSEQLGGGLPTAAARMVEELSRFTPPPVWPEETWPGLWNIPASLVLYPMSEGRLRVVPPPARLERVRRGIDAAASRRGIFHLCLHPETLAEGSRAFSIFEGMVEQLVRAREAGDIEILTMAQVADRMERRRGRSAPNTQRRYAAAD